MKLKTPPPNDRILSDAIMNQLTSFSDSEIEQIANLCLSEGPSQTPLKSFSGRGHNGQTVFDVVSLDPRWTLWFERIALDRDQLNAEIEGIVANDDDLKHLAGKDYDWTQIDWSALGRVIGSAILAQLLEDGELEKDYSFEIGSSSDVWNDIEKAAKNEKLELDNPIPAPVFNKAIEALADRGLDPSAEISRCPEGPSKSISDTATFVRVNPLVKRVRERLRTRGRGWAGSGDPKSRAKALLGAKCLDLIDDALNSLVTGDVSGFALTLHGLIGYVCVRNNTIAQKVGMHMFSSLLARREVRNVECLLLCDLAGQLDTKFSIGKAMKTLSDKNIISWNYIDSATLVAALPN